METFSWIPDFGGQADTTPKVSVVSYGDGYEQRFAVGLNSNRTTWNLTFENRDQDETDDIIDFLSSRGGIEAFEWVPPGEADPLFFVCRKWTKTFVKGGYYTVSLSFEQVFEP